jgi:hypothetical protein
MKLLNLRVNWSEIEGLISLGILIKIWIALINEIKSLIEELISLRT